MANRIFLAYANQKDKPLPSLREEDDKLFEILSRREAEEHFKLHRDAYITSRKLGRYLKQYRNEIIVFHYSGHAGGKQLFLEDKPAMADGIANYLAQCPNLKLVILNGCSTVGQVKRLLALKTQPVVIATHAPVGDQSATVFATTFFEYLSSQGKTVQEAFDAALDQVQLSEKKVEVLKSIASRYNRREDDKKTLWGLFSPSEVRLNWKLPTESVEMASVDFEPNSILINKLLDAYAPYFERAQTIKDQGEKASQADKIKAILEPLPLPVSEHLRKLMAPEKIGSAHKFFDRIGKDRLRQIGVAYSTIIELISFILLAELWELGLKKKKVSISEAHFADLKQFFKLSYDDRHQYHFPHLIEILQQILKKNKASIFVEELLDLLPTDQVSNELGSTLEFLEGIKNCDVDSLEDHELHSQCIQGEKALASLYSHLAFMANYSISSVKSIDVQNYRHSTYPEFSHRVVRLIQTFVNKLQEDKAVSQEFMYTASVVLMKNGEKQFLNLSPFIIDQNAFEENTELAMLHYFEVYEKNTDSFAFKHVYKPEEFSLETTDNKRVYEVIKEQFNAFTQLMFNQSINAL